MLSIRGYEDRQIDEWHRTRSLEYVVYCAVTEKKDRKSVFEYMPLENDPTPQEIKAAIEAQKKAQAAFWKKKLVDLSERGLIKLKGE